MSEKENVYKSYNKIAGWFAENRPVQLIEKPYLDRLQSLIPKPSTILDLGCGNGKPIMEYLLQSGFKVVGVDASEKMLHLAKQNFPAETFLLQDMRDLELDNKFNAIIAWHSFFHLPAIDQPKMFEIFANYLVPGGMLLFTSGSERGEVWGLNGGENLFHASLDSDDYRLLLQKHQFEIINHTVNDPACGYATVWLAQFNPQ
ncbi:class I SAM-dependent methyltransferase [Pedobacter agri]|uniref:class I SAM-dependent methyltransferase n=1 Tax=Pedobacter agri TaxID=454586 RepID=UPI002931B018|nr:class I SAM-dependent methyltransferase [Pedobacter agri]